MVDLKKEIIRLYKKIQKVPYHFVERRDPKKLFDIGKGCCFEKNVFLAREYEKLGIPVKYFLIEFYWRDLPIPKHIIKKIENPENHWQHLAFKIKVVSKWIWVDSSWDIALAKAGFPVTKDWDGKSDTKLAVKPLDIKLTRRKHKTRVVTTQKEFFRALNEYLEKVRKR